MKIKRLIVLVIVIIGVSILAGYFIRYTSNQFQSHVGWQTINDTKFIFRHPAQLDTKYIRTEEWPPKVSVYENKLVCNEGSNQMGKTEKKVVNNHEYCATISSEGAAGSVYTQYAYAREIKGKTVVLGFTLKSVQCGNYDDPQKSECEKERADFNIDNFADEIFGTLRLK